MGDISTSLGTIASSPTTVGFRRGSWRLDRVFTARKICAYCGVAFGPNVTPTRIPAEVEWNATRFCSISCGKKFNNPMHSESAREKMSKTLRAIGHAPKTRGGNGRGMTEPQKHILEILGTGWVAELAIPTKVPRSAKLYPTCYRVDLGNLRMKIAIELDGRSHNGRRSLLDVKKDEFLVGLGWKVLRLSNESAMSITSTSLAILLTSLQES